jgi:hypothetical protein
MYVCRVDSAEAHGRHEPSAHNSGLQSKFAERQQHRDRLSRDMGTHSDAHRDGRYEQVKQMIHAQMADNAMRDGQSLAKNVRFLLGGGVHFLTDP